MRRSRLPAKSACSSNSQTTLSSLGTNGKSDRTFLPDVREAKSASLDTRAFQFRGVTHLSGLIAIQSLTHRVPDWLLLPEVAVFKPEV